MLDDVQQELPGNGVALAEDMLRQIVGTSIVIAEPFQVAPGAWRKGKASYADGDINGRLRRQPGYRGAAYMLRVDHRRKSCSDQRDFLRVQLRPTRVVGREAHVHC